MPKPLGEIRRPPTGERKRLARVDWLMGSGSGFGETEEAQLWTALLHEGDRAARKTGTFLAKVSQAWGHAAQFRRSTRKPSLVDPLIHTQHALVFFSL